MILEGVFGRGCKKCFFGDFLLFLVIFLMSLRCKTIPNVFCISSQRRNIPMGKAAGFMIAVCLRS